MPSNRCAADCQTGMPGVSDWRHVQHDGAQITVSDSCREAATGVRPPEAVVNASSGLAVNCKAHKAVTEACAPQSSQQSLTHDSPRQHLCSPSQASQSCQPQQNQTAGNDTATGSCALGGPNLHPYSCAAAPTEPRARGQSAQSPDALNAPAGNNSTAKCTQVRLGHWNESQCYLLFARC